jgi:lipopolysaccharide transport system ATP-binding protein
MIEKPIIRVENLTKVFKLPHERYSTMKQHFVNIFKPKAVEKLKALDGVSFEVKKGEFFGIIGPNGSGKSTLLKILAEIYQPTSGEVEIKGSLSPFIELGVGFNPELTARGNVFLNAAILGLSKKETEDRFDEIIKFAELEEFVEQKLKNFSSGMQVRLAFSIAAQAQADILLVDEVLAVGDAAFQQKCFEVFRRLKREGKTVVFVSHALGIVEEFCDRVLVMKNGASFFIGNPQKANLEYLRSNLREEKGDEDEESFKTSKEKKTLKVTKIEFLNKDFKDKRNFETGEPLNIRIHYLATRRVEKPVVGIALHRDDGVHLTGPNTKDSKYPLDYIEGKGYIDYRIEKIPMHAGRFLLTVGLFDENVSFAYDFVDKGASFKVAPTEINQAGLIKLDATWDLVQK